MTAVRFTLVTVECDSTDPAIMSAIRELLERAGGSSSVVVASAPQAPAKAAAQEPGPKHTSIARHLMDGSLQELVMEAVTERPGATVADLAATVLNETTGSAKTRIGMAVGPLVLTGRLVRADDGKLYTPAAAATLPAFQGNSKRTGKSTGSKDRPKDPPPVAPEEPSIERAPCPSFPPCKNCREGSGACVSLVKQATPVEPGPAAEPKSAPAAVPAVEPAIDVGRVEGFVEQARQQGSLSEQIFEAVTKTPGTSVDKLASELLGSAGGAAVRRIDMLVGPMVMSGRLARYNGRLYTSMAQAAKLKLGPPVRGKPGPKRDDGTKHDAYKLYDKIVAAFAKDNAYPLHQLADELFGESVGHTYQKLQLMLRQLVVSERLERRGNGSYRPVDDKERRGRADEDDEEEKDDDEPELESNGQPDELDDLQELDVG